jgi:hypothetical protein
MTSVPFTTVIAGAVAEPKFPVLVAAGGGERARHGPASGGGRRVRDVTDGHGLGHAGPARGRVDGPGVRQHRGPWGTRPAQAPRMPRRLGR